jgi:hypothetical protein
MLRRVGLLGTCLLFFFGCQASLHARAGAAGEGGGAACEHPDAALGAPPPVRGNDLDITLSCGTYHGDLVVHGNDVRVDGAGKGKTIVDGRLVVEGNDIHVSGVTILGESDVHGNDVDVSGAELAAPSRVKGNDITQ